MKQVLKRSSIFVTIAALTLLLVGGLLFGCTGQSDNGNQETTGTAFEDTELTELGRDFYE